MDLRTQALVFYSAVHIAGHVIGTVPGVLQKDVGQLNQILGRGLFEKQKQLLLEGFRTLRFGFSFGKADVFRLKVFKDELNWGD